MTEPVEFDLNAGTKRQTQNDTRRLATEPMPPPDERYKKGSYDTENA